MLNLIKSDYEKWNSKVFQVDCDEFLGGNLFFENGIYCINLGSIKIDILLKNLEYKEQSGNHCLVVFGGALSKRGAPPFFSGVNLSAELKAPLITGRIQT